LKNIYVFCFIRCVIIFKFIFTTVITIICIIIEFSFIYNFKFKFGISLNSSSWYFFLSTFNIKYAEFFYSSLLLIKDFIFVSTDFLKKLKTLKLFILCSLILFSPSSEKISFPFLSLVVYLFSTSFTISSMFLSTYSIQRLGVRG